MVGSRLLWWKAAVDLHLQTEVSIDLARTGGGGEERKWSSGIWRERRVKGTHKTMVSLKLMSIVFRSTCTSDGVSITWLPIRNRQKAPKWVWLSTFP